MEADTAPVCETCGTQYPDDPVPDACLICTDERQYVPARGQTWTTLAALRSGHRNGHEVLEPGLHAFRTHPQFAIGQRALLVRSDGGNILWDCITLIDDATVATIGELGGIAAIAISHPHYYTTMAEWARTFDAPVYLHAADREWVVRPDSRLHFWEGETLVLHDGLTLIRCGGHFEGATVLHWPAGADGRGVLLSGDVLQVVPDRRHVSFMRSYPNLIPLPATTVRRIAAAVEPFPFDRIYGAFHEREILADGEGAVARSVERYVDWVGGMDGAGG